MLNLFYTKHRHRPITKKQEEKKYEPRKQRGYGGGEVMELEE